MSKPYAIATFYQRWCPTVILLYSFKAHFYWSYDDALFWFCVWKRIPPELICSIALIKTSPLSCLYQQFFPAVSWSSESGLDRTHRLSWLNAIKMCSSVVSLFNNQYDLLIILVDTIFIYFQEDSCHAHTKILLFDGILKS